VLVFFIPVRTGKFLVLLVSAAIFIAKLDSTAWFLTDNFSPVGDEVFDFGEGVALKKAVVGIGCVLGLG